MRIDPPIKIYDGALTLVDLVTEKYRDGNLAIVAVYDDGETHTMSANIPEQAHKLQAGEFFLRNWSEHAILAEPLIAGGYIELTGDSVPSGYVRAPIARLKG